MDGINYNVAHKFNLAGLVAGDKFLGCIKCQKIFAVNAVGVCECSNCLGKLKQYTVTPTDFGYVQPKIEGDYCFGNNDFYHAKEE